MSFSENLRAVAHESGYAIPPAAVDRLAIHYRLLRQWGSRTNLTGLRTREAIVKRHFMEPIAAADLLDGEGTLLDLGSGNGFPAVPLAILHPGARLVLIEASEKKSAFLLTVLREAGLKAAQVVTRRICRRADLTPWLPVRWLTYRGVRIDETLCGPGPELLVPNGRMLAFVSSEEARRLAAEPPAGLRWSHSRPLPMSPDDVVAVFERAA